MVNTKNKKTKRMSVRSARRVMVGRSRLARSKGFSKKSNIWAWRVILVVIILTMMTVILATLLSIFNTPEKTVTRKIESIAKDYYENYYYDNVVEAAASRGDTVENILGKYSEKGFSEVDLDQLLLFDGGRHIGAGATLKSYCDKDHTRVKIYPEAPFGRTDYRLEINYACKF